MSWDPAVIGGSVIAGDSPLETERFGLTFSRVVVPLTLGEKAFDEVLTFLADDDADVIVLRYPAARVDWFAGLLTSGRDLVLADSLTYWQLAVGTGRRPTEQPGLTAVASAAVDPGLIDDLVDDIFTGYGNHYSANPLLSPVDSLAGYREWAQRSAANDPVVTLTSQEGGVVGVATIESTAGTCEIQLAGIKAEFQQRGLYAHLLAGCEKFAEEAGATQLVISTQTHNANVQRAWSRFGFEPVGTFLTAHAIRKGLLPR